MKDLIIIILSIVVAAGVGFLLGQWIFGHLISYFISLYSEFLIPFI